MAKPLDRDTYRLVEWNLHHEALMRDIITQFENDVLLSSPGTDYSRPNVQESTQTSDPVSRRAFRLEEGTAEVRRARRWVRVIERTRGWFANTPEGRLFELFYGRTATVELVAAAMGTPRRRVDQLRDNVVFRGTMYALEERLFKLEDIADGKEREA